jgi:C4-dicarboxylate transporter DctQ subunit
MSNWLNTLFNAIERALALAFMGTVALSLANAIGRYGLGLSFAWIDELQVNILIWMTFLGAAVASQRQRHLRIDLLARLLPPAGRAVLNLAEQLLVLCLCSLAAWHSVAYVRNLFALDLRSDGAGLPLWIVHAALPIGLTMIALLAVLTLLDGRRKPQIRQ